MPIRSIDMQVLIPHAPEISKIQQTTDHSLQLQQQQFMEELQLAADKNQHQTPMIEQRDGATIQKEHQNQGGGYSSLKRQKKDARQQKKTEPTEVSADSNCGHFIDVRT